MFAPIIIDKHDGEYEHVTMALLDSGNLLQQPAINAKLHQTLGVGVVKTNVVARLTTSAYPKQKTDWSYSPRQPPKPKTNQTRLTTKLQQR